MGLLRLESLLDEVVYDRPCYRLDSTLHCIHSISLYYLILIELLFLDCVFILFAPFYINWRHWCQTDFSIPVEGFLVYYTNYSFLSTLLVKSCYYTHPYYYIPFWRQILDKVILAAADDSSGVPISNLMVQFTAFRTIASSIIVGGLWFLSRLSCM